MSENVDNDKVSWWWKAFAIATLADWFLNPVIDRITGWHTIHIVGQNGHLIRAEICDPENWCAHGPMANVIRARGK